MVFGGSNHDTLWRVSNRGCFSTGGGVSHEAKVRTAAGGVAFNLATAFANLDMNPKFVSLVGNDLAGDFILNHDSKLCKSGIRRLSGVSTASYCSVLEEDSGEVRLGMGDMAAHRLIDPDMVINSFDFKPRLVAFDANLTKETIDSILKTAKNLDVPYVLLEPTSANKSTLPFATDHADVITHISPNLEELRAIRRFLAKDLELAESGTSLPEIARDCHIVFGKSNLKTIVVTLGKNGVLIANRDTVARHYAVRAKANVTSVSGAGDCFISAFMAALLRGHDQDTAVAAGFQAAHCCLGSLENVPINIGQIDWNEAVQGQSVA